MAVLLDDMKFLVTGGAGFIGKNIVKVLLEDGNSVDVIDNFHTNKKSNLDETIDQINLFQVDITDKPSLTKVISDYDGIFHEAALTSVPESFEKSKEYYEVNVLGIKNIFEIAKERKIRVVFASSSSVYGETENIPINENFPRNPISPYGKTKLDAEKLAEQYSAQGLEVIGLRYFNAYGSGQTRSYAGVISNFLENIISKKPLKIYGNGQQVRDFIHVSDVAEANLAVMNSKVKSGFFNVGTQRATSINELAQIMINISGHKEGIIHTKTLEGDIRASLADMSCMHKMFGWKHVVNLNEGLKKLIGD